MEIPNSRFILIYKIQYFIFVVLLPISYLFYTYHFTKSINLFYAVRMHSAFGFDMATYQLYGLTLLIIIMVFLGLRRFLSLLGNYAIIEMLKSFKELLFCVYTTSFLFALIIEIYIRSFPKIPHVIILLSFIYFPILNKLLKLRYKENEEIIHSN